MTAIAVMTASTSAFGQTAEALMEVLVRKGILTEQEAEDIKVELARENDSANKVKAPGKTTKRIEIYGDFRGRYENFSSSEVFIPGNDDDLELVGRKFGSRSRWRYRARVGVKAALTENFEVGMRIGSGDIDRASRVLAGIDPISQNQTMYNNASKKGVFIDLAYGRWAYSNYPLTPWSGDLAFGKIKNPYTFSKLVFDSDYTPEGFGGQVGYQFNLEHQLTANGGAFVLDEFSTDSDDPYMVGGQLRFDSIWKYNAAFKPKISSSLGVAYMYIGNEDGLVNGAVPNINVGNTRDATGAPVARFQPVILDGALTYTLDRVPYYSGFFPITLKGEYMKNTGYDDNDTGYSVGIKFGKAGKKATWEIGYTWRYLAPDVWYEELVDSDFGAFYARPPDNSGFSNGGYGAGTNVKGHVFQAKYTPYNALTFIVSYYYTKLVEEFLAGGDGTMHRVQVDALLKF
jgi:hypothetical protein